MKLWMIGPAVLAVLGVFSWWNWRRFMPKARVLGKKKYKVEIQKLSVETDGKQLYGELLLPKGKAGKLPTVICCHGYGSSYKLCERLAGRSLAMSGYAAYCFDFCGGSKKSKSGGSMMEMSVLTEKEELLAVIDRIRALDVVDEEQLFLLGESQGGMVSGITAPERQDAIRALILYYPAFCIPDDAHRKFASAESIPETTEAFGLPISRKYYADVWNLDVFSTISAYTRPVLVIHGDNDEVVDVFYGRKAAEVYPDAEFKLLPGEIHGFYGKGKVRALELSFQFLERNGK